MELERWMVTLFRGEVNLEEVQALMGKIDWALKRFTVDLPDLATIGRVYISYIRAHNKLPKSTESLREWIDVAAQYSALQPEEKAWFSDRNPMMKTGLSQLQRMLKDEEPEPYENFLLATKALIEFARRIWYTRAGIACNRICGQGGMPNPKKGLPNLEGPEDARRYYMDMVANDVGMEEFKEFGGDWIGNIEVIRQTLKDYLKPENHTRLLTGFPMIDEVSNIGPQQDCRFVGLLAASNHGKSTVLTTMLYNMAKDGARVLYMPCESSAKLAMIRLSWLHAKSQKVQDKMPSMSDYKLRPDNVTDHHERIVDSLIDDLKKPGTIKGSITIRKANCWADAAAHIANTEEPWDVIAIDYVGDFVETKGGQQRDNVSLINEVFSKVKMLTATYKGRGVVVISPLQANKKGIAEVREKEGPEVGSYEHMAGAVEYYTKAYQGMDLVIGIWKLTEREIVMSCAKMRDDKYFKPWVCEVHPITRLVTPVREVNPSYQYGDKSGKVTDSDRNLKRDVGFESLSEMEMVN